VSAFAPAEELSPFATAGDAVAEGALLWPDERRAFSPPLVLDEQAPHTAIDKAIITESGLIVSH